jgi:hypothetical protein
MLRPKLKLVENAPADPNGPPALEGSDGSFRRQDA